MPLSYDDKKRIACDLVARGILKKHYYEAWNRRTLGESYAEIRLTIRQPGRRKTCDEEQERRFVQKHPSVRTVRMWKQKAREAIELEYEEGRERYEIPTHQGADVLERSDNTPQSKGLKSSLDCDKMRLWGKLPRF